VADAVVVVPGKNVDPAADVVVAGDVFNGETADVVEASIGEAVDGKLVVLSAGPSVGTDIAMDGAGTAALTTTNADATAKL